MRVTYQRWYMVMERTNVGKWALKSSHPCRHARKGNGKTLFNFKSIYSYLFNDNVQYQ